MPTRSLLLLPLIALAACQFEAKVDPKQDADVNEAAVDIRLTGDGNAAVGDDRVSIDAPGFKASLKVPGLEMGGDAMDIDGLKLYPGSTVTGVDVQGDRPDGKGGQVRMGLRSGDAPDRVMAYYRRAAAEAGYTVAPPTRADGETVLAATKGPDKDIRIALRPEGAGSVGSILITGD